MHTIQIILGLGAIMTYGSRVTHAAASPASGPTFAPYDTNTVFERSLDDLPMEPMRWIGQVEEGGPNVTISGTPHEVAAKIHKLNPYWKRNTTHMENMKRDVWSKIKEIEDAGANESAVVASSNSSLMKRTYDRTNWYCNQRNYGRTDCQPINDDIDWFTANYGNGWCAAGPNSCGRFTCSYNSATLMCASGAEAVIPCKTLAINFYFTLFICQTSNYYDKFCRIEGQTFYINPSYNVLLKHTDNGRGC